MRICIKMRTVISLLIVLFLVSILQSHQRVIAQNSPQCAYVPDGAKTRLGKGRMERDSVFAGWESNCPRWLAVSGIWIYDASTGNEVSLRHRTY